MYENNNKSVYPKVNYTLSLLSIAGLMYLAWKIICFKWAFATYILMWVVFIPVVGLQVLLLALSMGKQDKYKEPQYDALVPFNKIVLVIYLIYIILLHILTIREWFF